MIAIVDYGVGNLFSLRSSLQYIGQDAAVTNSATALQNSDRIILPGVGAFEDAARKLRNSGLYDVVTAQARSGKPLLGVCLGMQLLFEKSYEYGEHEGLGLIKGRVVSMEPVVPKGYKIPQIGWNGLIFPKDKAKSPLFKYIREGDCVYFVHSYYASDCDEAVIATTEYGAELTAAVADGNIYGTQFHPEKSGDVGLNILRAFCEI
ncbi:imidazole glycerol phosphate synthase subunit HisH [Oscillospiraceae bacterium CM]|nr:imidazole glycerol phosphate synthase subunit HisH [Oscillospiraceae bacterium CM]